MKAKKVFSLGLTGVLAAALAMPTGGVFAAENYDSVIDTSKTGSITIHKLVENDGKTVISDGHATETESDGTIKVTDPLDSSKSEEFEGTEDYTKTKPGYQKNADGTIEVTDDSYLPLDNIGYSYQKIADIAQVNGYKIVNGQKEAAPSVGIYFTNFDQGLLALGTVIGVDGPEVTKFDGMEGNYYTTASVEKWLADFNQVTSGNGHEAGEEMLRTYLKSHRLGEEKTDETGSTKQIDNLALGLYLIGETDISAHDGLDGDKQYKIDSHELNPEYPVVESESAPFLVSLPTTNVADVAGNKPGTVWEYALDVYPKNQTNSILKRIVDPDDEGDSALRIREDYQIGDVVNQVIYADAPCLQTYTPADLISNQQGNQAEEPLDEVDTYAIGVEPKAKWHEKFVIKDTMSSALTFNKVTKVAIIPKAVNPKFDTDLAKDEVVLVEGTDYTVDGSTEQQDADHNFSVTLTEDGLKKLDAREVDSQVVVYFSCSLNGNAQIGKGDANQNHPTLTWKNSNTAEKEVDGNYVYDYTYELDLKKTGLENASRAVFTVMHTDDNNRTYNKEDGSQSVKDAAEADVKFVKIADGEYRVYDELHDSESDIFKVTVNGQEYTNAVQPAKDGKLHIKGFDSDVYTFKEISTENGKNLLKSTFQVEFVEDGDPVFSYKDGEGSADKLQDGELIRATLTADGQETNLEITGNGGIANATVENFKSITLRTGGEGRTAIYISGAAALGLIGVAIIAHKKKRAI